MGTVLIAFIAGLGAAVVIFMLARWVGLGKWGADSVAAPDAQTPNRNGEPVDGATDMPMALVETRNHLQLVVDSMFDGLITLDADGGVLAMNHMAQKISGYSEADIDGLKCEQMLGDVMLKRGDYVDPKEAQLTRFDGEVLPVEVAVRVVTASRGNLALLTIRDISSFKAAQKTLQQQSQIIDESESFVFVADKDHRIEWCNKRFEALTGYSLAELKELESVRRLIGEANSTRKMLSIDKAVRQQKCLKTEILLRSKNGRPYWVLLNLMPLHDTNGDFEKFAGLGFDITDQKIAEQMQSEFVSMVSHELRTPLTVIAGSLDALQLNPGMQTVEAEAMLIEMARRNCVRLETLIEDLLDISKIENGTLSFQCENTDVIDLVKRSVDDITSLAERGNLTVTLEFNRPDLVVFVDPTRLAQVMTNLLSNAIKFSPEGASVAVRVTEEAERVVVSVQDAGRGIADDFRPMIFKRFSREASVQADGTEGFGLGLSICKQLIEQMNGDIGFESDLGKGSTFYFSLPLVPQTEPALACVG